MSETCDACGETLNENGNCPGEQAMADAVNKLAPGSSVGTAPLGRTIYLASSFSLSERVQRVYEALADAGHHVPDVWWNDDLKEIDLPDAEWYDHPDVEAIAQRHWDSIRKSDTYVLVCPPDQPKKYNGANVELGYAHAYGLECYSVGALERSAMYVPVTRTGSIPELLDQLETDGKYDER